MPTAASTRPQLGSDPNIAVLTRLSRAIARAAATASSSEAAPVTVTVTRLVTPSASACSCAHRSSQTRSTASSSSAWRGAIPLAPEASSSTVSLVEQQPSMSSRSKVRAVARRSAWSSAAGVGDRVGGEHAQHGGQRRRQHARALGHAADGPVVRMVQRNLFGHRVGGHDGVRGLVAAGQPAGHLVHDLRAPRRAPCPSAAGHRSDPVEQTATSMAPVSVPQSDNAAATASAVAWVSWKPPGPVQALAPPELRITARSCAGGQHLLGPQHRRGLDLVAGEHAGGRVVGSFVEDQREVAVPGCLDAGGDAGGPEPGRRGDALRRAPAAPRPPASPVTARPRPPKGLPSPANPAPGSSTAPRRRPCP